MKTGQHITTALGIIRILCPFTGIQYPILSSKNIAIMRNVITPMIKHLNVNFQS